MLDNCATKEERWEGVQNLIGRWLAERQDLIVLYCSVSGTYQFSLKDKNSIPKLKQFCQILVDYMSAGHFEVYDQLVREAEAFGDDISGVLNRLLPEITETTNIALDFNDIYDTDEHCEKAMDQLTDRLSGLGEVLVQRFALEDELIASLHNQHAAELNS